MAEIVGILIIAVFMFGWIVKYPAIGFYTSLAFFILFLGLFLRSSGWWLLYLIPATLYLVVSFLGWKWVDKYESEMGGRVTATIITYLLAPIFLAILAGGINSCVEEIDQERYLKEKEWSKRLTAATSHNDLKEISAVAEELGEVSRRESDRLAEKITHRHQASLEVLNTLAKLYPELAEGIFIASVKSNKLDYMHALADHAGDLNRLELDRGDKLPLLFYARSEEALLFLIAQGARLDQYCIMSSGYSEYKYRTSTLYQRLRVRADTEDTLIKAIDLVPQDIKKLALVSSSSTDSLFRLMVREKMFRLTDKLLAMGIQKDPEEMLDAEDIEEIKYLLQLGIPIDQRDYWGDSALTHAINHNHVDMELIRFFLDAGANIDLQNYQGKTALMIAAENNIDPSILINFLVNQGADISVKSEEGKTAWDYILDSTYYSEASAASKSEIQKILQPGR